VCAATERNKIGGVTNNVVNKRNVGERNGAATFNATYHHRNNNKRQRRATAVPEHIRHATQAVNASRQIATQNNGNGNTRHQQRSQQATRNNSNDAGTVIVPIASGARA